MLKEVVWLMELEMLYPQGTAREEPAPTVLASTQTTPLAAAVAFPPGPPPAFRPQLASPSATGELATPEAPANISPTLPKLLVPAEPWPSENATDVSVARQPRILPVPVATLASPLAAAQVLPRLNARSVNANRIPLAITMLSAMAVPARAPMIHPAMPACLPLVPGESATMVPAH